MAKQYLYDSASRCIAYIETDNGKQRLYSNSSVLLGWYVISEDKTYNINGALVGTGNLLMTLLKL